jgi:hypothetical protein
MRFCNIHFNQRNIVSLLEIPDNHTLKVIIPTNAALIVEANTSRRFFDILKNNFVIFDGAVPYFAAKILFALRLLPS